MQIDGKETGTASVGRSLARHKMAQHKKAADEAGGAAPMNEGSEGASEHDHGGQEGGHEVIQQMTAEHGPAHTVEVAKEGEHHTVKTTHEDGHAHASKGHPSVSHVHEHIGHAAGASEAEAPGESEGEAAGGESGYGSLADMGVGGE